MVRCWKINTQAASSEKENKRWKTNQLPLMVKNTEKRLFKKTINLETKNVMLVSRTLKKTLRKCVRCSGLGHFSKSMLSVDSEFLKYKKFKHFQMVSRSRDKFYNA